MNSQEALDLSPNGVARLTVEEGLVAIARSVAGYHVSFIPRTREGMWNLAATQTLGTAGTVDEAEAIACADRECVLTMWEPAGENIVGNEPAVSVAPAVEGHQIRYHGDTTTPTGGMTDRLVLACIVASAALAIVLFIRRDRS